MPTVKQKKPIPKKSSKGYLYLVKCHNYYKIGICGRSPKDRMCSMQVGNPYTLELVAYVYVKELEYAEWILQNVSLPTRNIRGEWFELNDHEVDVVQMALTEFYRISNAVTKTN